MVHGNRARLPAIARRALLVGVVVAGVVVIPVGPGGQRRADAFPSTSVTFTGHGFGHGRGMGQYGALGYALNQGWTYHQILDHYYGGTTTGHTDPATPMTVDMTSRDGLDTIVAQERGELTTSPPITLGCASGTACAVRISRTGPSTFRVYQASSCSGGTGGWTVVAPAVSATAVTVRPTTTSADRQDMLQLCETNDIRWLRGSLVAQDTGSGQATVNVVPVDLYVQGVVPRESPSSWGSMGGGAGEQALDAQAVAARSYALAENRWPYARTCDTTTCQVYGGRAVETFDGTFTDLEGTSTYANSNAAVAATSGETRVSSGGAVVRTEFSSSTGGYTAGGAFPAVPDDGDATASNPNHSWTASIPVTDIESAYATTLGPLLAINVTSRNGLGDLGGRVLTVDVAFENGRISTTGNELAAALGLKSNWFSVTDNPTVPYHAVTADGTVYPFGGAPALGSLSSSGVHTTAVGMAEGPGGYWVLATNGAVYGFGSVSTYGSVAAMHLNRPPRQIVATPSGRGYWIMASDGGVFSFGDAHFWGSTGNRRLNAPVVGIAPSPDGGGYWLLGADGGIFTFGDARFFGSTGNLRLNAPVNAMAALPNGAGYWLAAADGGLFSFGQAVFEGSLPGRAIRATAVGMQASPSGQGYLIATATGHVYGFGDAIAVGGPADARATSPTVGVAFARS
jgi:peptidoglycan hydrolase-like amidase